MRGHAHPTTRRLQALALRREGRSLLEISQALGIPKNTISMWVREVVLSDAQRAQLEEKCRVAGAQGRPLAVEAWRKRIDLWKTSIEQDVKPLGALPFSNPAIGKVACGLLYICEGGRYPASRQLTFGNSDPRMIALFLRLLRSYFAVDGKKFRARVMHRWDQNGEMLRQFWSHRTGIPLTQFFASYADARTQGRPTKRLDYRGVCAIHYPSTTLQYQLQAIGESVMRAAVNGVPEGAGNDFLVAERPVPGYHAVEEFMPWVSNN